MTLAIVLSLAASFCTATSSVCQRLGARGLERGGSRSRGLDFLLIFRLARQPFWLVGFAAMIAGFVFQVSALHFGPLALVQPILVAELLFVFGYLAVLLRDRHAVRWREWTAAAAMSAGISVFLRAAAPSGGQPHASALAWWLAGASTLAVVAIMVLAGGGFGTGEETSTRRAACLGIATGVAWGFVAAVIKELSSHVTGGPVTLFTNWSVYVLMAAGAAAMVLTSNAMAAGPLAASQPGYTLCDPLVAVMLGAFVFREQLQTTAAALAGEVLGLILLVIGVWALSGSPLICETGPR